VAVVLPWRELRARASPLILRRVAQVAGGVQDQLPVRWRAGHLAAPVVLAACWRGRLQRRALEYLVAVPGQVRGGRTRVPGRGDSGRPCSSYSARPAAVRAVNAADTWTCSLESRPSAPRSSSLWCSTHSARPLSRASGPPKENQRTCAASRPAVAPASCPSQPQKAH